MLHPSLLDREKNPSNNVDMKVMEMINKNVSTDFEALKKHAMKDYWHMDEVNLFQISKNTYNHFSIFSSSCSSARKG